MRGGEMAKKSHNYLELSDVVCAVEGCRKRIKQRLIEEKKRPRSGWLCYNHYAEKKAQHKHKVTA